MPGANPLRSFLCRVKEIGWVLCLLIPLFFSVGGLSSSAAGVLILGSVHRLPWILFSVDSSIHEEWEVAIRLLSIVVMFSLPFIWSDLLVGLVLPWGKGPEWLFLFLVKGWWRLCSLLGLGMRERCALNGILFEYSRICPFSYLSDLFLGTPCLRSEKAMADREVAWIRSEQQSIQSSLVAQSAKPSASYGATPLCFLAYDAYFLCSETQRKDPTLSRLLLCFTQS